MKRRQFVSGTALSGAAFLPLASNAFAAGNTAVKADQVLINARIYSMDPAVPQAEAIALRGNRILALGSNDDMLSLRAANSEISDVGGGVMFPGFIDAHSHPAGAAENTGADVNRQSIAEIQSVILEQAGKTPEIARSLRQKSVAYLTGLMAASGLTSTTDAFGTVESLVAYQDARAAGELKTRLSFMPYGPSPLFEHLKAAGLRSGFGDEWIRFGAVKYWADGSALGHTMRMSTAFIGRPDDYGILIMDQDEIHAAVADAVANGWRIGIHANGDTAIDMTLNAYERALSNWQGPNPRFRIEHCSLANPELLKRIKNTGSIPVPFYTYAHNHGEKWKDYGSDKMEWMFAHRSFLDYGIPVAPASNYTAGPFEPLMAIQSMVTRKDSNGTVWGPSQRISVDQALRICTVNGAWASGEEQIKGSLTPGKLADLVVLGADPHDTDPDRIKNIPVLRTMVDGKTVHLS